MFTRITFKNLFCLALVSTTFIACGKSGKKIEAASKEVLPGYTEITSCEFGAGEGQGLMEVQGPLEATSYNFQKKYDSSWLLPLMRSSLSETAHFIHKKGVNIWAINVQEKGCAFSIPDSAPEKLQQEFNVTDNSDSSTSLLGLYLPQGSDRLKNITEKPTILIKRNTDRWTLIHEFMHHNFVSHQQYALDLELFGHIDEGLQGVLKFKEGIEDQDEWLEFKNSYLGLLRKIREYMITFPLKFYTV